MTVGLGTLELNRGSNRNELARQRQVPNQGFRFGLEAEYLLVEADTFRPSEPSRADLRAS